MAEDKMFTQEEVNKLVGAARLEGKDTVRKEYEGWISPDELTKQTEDLNKQLSGLNDQIQALTDEKAALTNQLSEKDGKIAVSQVIANEFGLSYEAKEFLQGENEEEIRKSAMTLKSIVGSGKGEPLFNPEPAKDGNTTDQAMREMLGKLGG